MSINAKKSKVSTPLTIALEHFSYDSNKFANKIAQEIFRKDIFLPLLGIKNIKPYDYFNQYEDNDVFSGFFGSIVTNHITNTASFYVYDCAFNISNSKPLSLDSLKKGSEESSLVWFADKAALPFVLSRFNADPNGNLMENEPELASGLLSVFAMAKTVKEGFEHISCEFNNLGKSYYNYQQDDSVNNFNALFYSSVDFLGSLLTSGLAFAFTCKVQNSLHQNNDQYTRIAANLIVDYKVQNTAMFFAKTAVEFLVKLSINSIYNFLYPNIEESETNTVQEQYSNRTLSTDASDLETDSFSKALTVYRPTINAISMAFVMCGLASSNEQSDSGVSLRIDIAQNIFRTMMEASAFDYSEIWLPDFDSTSIDVIDVSGSVCLPQE